VREGKSIRAAAKDANIDRMTLKRYIDKKENVPLKKTGYDGVAEARRILSDGMDSELAKHYLGREKVREGSDEYGSTYPAHMLNLPHTRGKLCHETPFFGHAILSKQLCLHSFCLFEGMHNILKYLLIY